MPTATYIALANYTVAGAGDGEVEFTSIPASFRDLVLVINIVGLSGTPTTAGAYLQVNSDTGSNYSYVYMRGSGSAATSVSVASDTKWGDALFSSDNPHNAIIQFMDYSATNKHKTMLSRTNDPSSLGVAGYAGRWANTNAITSIKIVAPDSAADTFDIGSSFALYGVVS
jgi:hypothetical protein